MVGPPDFAEQTADLGITGICGSGIMKFWQSSISQVINSDGVVDGTLSSRSERIVEDGRTFAYVLHEGDIRIAITQNDVRAIQLAKAALYAGVRLLMDKLNVDTVDRIRLAGAFGSHIDVKYAMILGLIPDCALENVTSAGNAAGSGAHIALVDGNAREEIEREIRRIEKVETAVEAGSGALLRRWRFLTRVHRGAGQSRGFAVRDNVASQARWTSTSLPVTRNLKSVKESLSRVAMFQSLGEADLEVMAGVARQITAERGELIVSQDSDGESLYIVVDGQIRVYVSDEAGGEMILRLEGPGAIFGEIAVLDGELICDAVPISS